MVMEFLCGDLPSDGSTIYHTNYDVQGDVQFCYIFLLDLSLVGFSESLLIVDSNTAFYACCDNRLRFNGSAEQ